MVRKRLEMRVSAMGWMMDDSDDIYMQSLTGTIIGPHNLHLSLEALLQQRLPRETSNCSLPYTRINMTCVNPETGV
ncbi:Ubiquitin-conjugating enzyme E2 variant 1A, partial [Bienertia sinuspersici]